MLIKIESLFLIKIDMQYLCYMPSQLSQEIKYLQGVGPKRAELLNKELGIYSFYDLLYYFPYKYVDRTKFYTIREVTDNMPFVQIVNCLIELFFFRPGGKQFVQRVRN